jgi:acyl-CoA dehydrogenase
VLSYLYLASMVLKRHHDNGAPAEDLPVVQWACRSLLYKAQEQLHDFLRNFPNRLLAGLMRLLIFPRGRTYFAPSDRLGAQLAELVMTPSATRERLCRHAYRNPQGGNPLGLLQEALLMALAVEPLEKLLRVEGIKTGRVTALDVPGQIAQAQAIGLLTEVEAQALLDYDRRIMHLINVDDFAPHELAAGPG